MKKGKQVAIIIILIGVFVIYWAQTHSPNAKFGQIVGNQLSGSYTMGEAGYYFSLILGIGVLVLGIYRFVKR